MKPWARSAHAASAAHRRDVVHEVGQVVPVAVHAGEVDVERSAAVHAGAELGAHALAVAGVHQPVPQPGPLQQRGGLVAEEPLDGRAHVHQALLGQGHRPGHAGQHVGRGAVQLLERAQRRQRAVRRRGVLQVEQHPAVVEPQRLEAARQRPPLEVGDRHLVAHHPRVALQAPRHVGGGEQAREQGRFQHGAAAQPPLRLAQQAAGGVVGRGDDEIRPVEQHRVGGRVEEGRERRARSRRGTGRLVRREAAQREGPHGGFPGGTAAPSEDRMVPPRGAGVKAGDRVSGPRPFRAPRLAVHERAGLVCGSLMERTPAAATPRVAQRVRALGLLSGGLDSALAAALLLEQGLEVVGLHLESPVSCRRDVRPLARALGIPLIVQPKGEAFLELLRAPRWGYGRNLNPCVDCRIFMLRRAGEVMRETGAAFLFTGEVPGQRPMSQLRRQLRLIDRQSGLDGLILRPLAAKLLPETVPERRGWVDRARLLAVHGRSRKVQLAEAARLKLAHYESPGGGCRLTDPAYARRLRDLLEHSPAGLDGTAMELLAVGRHFRCGPGLKVVLGRDAAENARLAALAGAGRRLLEPLDCAGPSALVCGPGGEEAMERAAALVARYARAATPAELVRWRTAAGTWTRRTRRRPRIGPGRALSAAAIPNDRRPPLMQPTASPAPRARRRRATLALLATLLAPAPALPASDVPRPVLADTTRPVLFLEEVVVTGTRRPHAYYESPQALSFVSRRELREGAPVALGDVLSRLPGVDCNRDSPWEQRPSVRGLAGQRVLVLVDGEPMNSARGHGPHPALVDPGQVERIEVVRGPSSVAYGSDALGGVINILTRDPWLEAPGGLHGSVSLGGSTAESERDARLELVTRRGPLGVFVSGGGRRAEDFRAGGGGDVANSGFSDWNGQARLRYEATERLTVRLGYQFSRTRDVGIPGLSFVEPDATQLYQFAFYDRDHASLALEHTYPDIWLKDTRVSFYWHRERRDFFSDQYVLSTRSATRSSACSRSRTSPGTRRP